MMGDSRRRIMIRNPFSDMAESNASKITYFFVNPATESRRRYLPRIKDMVAPLAAPKKTESVPSKTPTPKPNALANTKPAPKVKIEPGKKKTVAKK
mmetsp:Transcript_24474/g.27872  ORF Transcript_24474/g.27872 Transcript_24474/m.27872 type:complete len:96 (+) Transcript_24474:672-959(+)